MQGNRALTEQFSGLEKKFRDENLFIERGKIYHQNGEFALALEELKKAAQINPGNENAHFEMANVYTKIKDDPRAEEEYKKALELKPDFSGAALELGKFYFYRQRKLDLAVENFNLVAKVEPRNWEANFELGKIYKMQQRYLSAAEVMKKAAELNPGNVQINFELGKLYRDLGMPELAIEEFRKAYSSGEASNSVFLTNKALNEIEITERKIILESKVRAMVGMIFNTCNVQCIMCTIWKTPWQASEKTMGEIVNLFPYMEDMVWEGGEVFMMKGFTEVLQEASRYPYLKQVIFTNGLAINERIIEILIRSRVDIVFSIDAATKETYEYIRKGGKLERLRGNLATVKQAKERAGGFLETHFNSVIMKSNYMEIEKLIDFALEFNFNAVTLTPIRGKFRDENIFEDNNIQALGYLKEVMPRVIEKAYKGGIIINNWLPGIGTECCLLESKLPPCEEIAVNKCRAPDYNDKLVCHAPWQRMVIDNEGQVRPFVFCLDKWIGNTNQSSLDEIWNSQAMQEYRTRIINRDFEKLCQPECISGQVGDKIRDII